MSLKEKLNSLPDVSRGTSCTLGKIINELPREDSEALINALSSGASTRAIFDVLKTEGYKIDRQTVTLHRKGFCRCTEAE